MRLRVEVEVTNERQERVTEKWALALPALRQLF